MDVFSQQIFDVIEKGKDEIVKPTDALRAKGFSDYGSTKELTGLLKKITLILFLCRQAAQQFFIYLSLNLSIPGEQEMLRLNTNDALT